MDVTEDEIKTLLREIKAEGLRKLFTLLHIKKRPNGIEAMLERIITARVNGILRSDKQIRANAASTIPTKGLTTNQVKQQLLKMGQANLVFELLPQTANQWYNHIRNVVATSGVGPFYAAALAAQTTQQVDTELPNPSPEIGNNFSSNNMASQGTTPVTKSINMMEKIKTDQTMLKEQLKSGGLVDIDFLLNWRNSANLVQENIDLARAFTDEQYIQVPKNLDHLQKTMDNLHTKYVKREGVVRKTFEDMIKSIPNYHPSDELLDEEHKALVTLQKSSTMYVELFGNAVPPEIASKFNLIQQFKKRVRESDSDDLEEESTAKRART